MAMTEHRSVSTVMSYFQAGSLLGSRASQLLTMESSNENAPNDLQPTANPS
jgi:hypothetical protein